MSHLCIRHLPDKGHARISRHQVLAGQGGMKQHLTEQLTPMEAIQAYDHHDESCHSSHGIPWWESVRCFGRCKNIAEGLQLCGVCPHHGRRAPACRTACGRTVVQQGVAGVHMCLHTILL